MSSDPHPLFDSEWYLQQNPDVAEAGINPLRHYEENGWREDRDPHPMFDTSYYLEQNPDVADAGMEPFSHYLAFGWKEGRNPHPDFNVSIYLDKYKDVAAAGVEPLEHYFKFGMREGRSPSADSTNVVDAKRRHEVEKIFLANQTPAFALSYSHAKFSKAGYEYEDVDPTIISGFEPTTKLFAFYLPQFHAIPENDQFWGSGFTEWRQLPRGLPRFPGHYQPRIPRDLGHYDLNDIKAISKQICLAKSAGVYGFGFYYYWFNGRRILHRPLESFLSSPSLSMPFFIIWANENWTRTWDGSNTEVLLNQDYRVDDEGALLGDLARHFADPRYFRINGRPLFVIYKPSDVPGGYDTFQRWKERWRHEFGVDPLFFMAQTFNFNDPAIFGLDGALEFPPHKLSAQITPRSVTEAFDSSFSATVLAYDEIVSASTSENPPAYPLIKTAVPSWDNDARRPGRGLILEGSDPLKYQAWLQTLVERTAANPIFGERIVAINAWNEWAEGAYLEPDVYWGAAYLNATARALRPTAVNLEDLDKKENGVSRKKIPYVLSRSEKSRLPGPVAVHLHIYFEETANELLENVNRIPFQFDLFVTTDCAEKQKRLEALFNSEGNQHKLEVITTTNIGRDIGPFLFAIAPKLRSYEYVGHFHSKKSTTVSWGDRWRKYLLDNLLGSSEGISSIFSTFSDDPKLGIIYPPAYPLIRAHYDWGGVKERSGVLLKHFGLYGSLPDQPSFPAGNMFWARVDSISAILNYPWTRSDFEHELGQLESTVPHCLERIWGYAASFSGYESRECLLKNREADKDRSQLKRLAIYVHYEPSKEVSGADIHYLASLRQQVEKLVVVSNNGETDKSLHPLSSTCDHLITRRNIGFDFGAWRDALFELGRPHVAEYDEVILANNSCYGPIFPISEMFETMRGSSCDFWGATAFPEIENSVRPEASLLAENNIPEHLQSYFLAIRGTVLRSDVFWDFWTSVEDKTDLLEVVTSYEMQLTGVLHQAGFKYGCYLPESIDLQKSNSHPEFNALYNLPFEFLLLRSPFIKKKSWLYASEATKLSCELIDAFGFYPVNYIYSDNRG